jgi:hypothetical protein
MRQGKMSPGEFDKWRKPQEREREEEMSKLRKMLEKEGLPLIALGGVGGEKGKEQKTASTEKDGEKGQGEGKDDGAGNKRSKDEDEEQGGKVKGGKAKSSWGPKLKSSLVPKRLANAVELAKNGPPGQSKRSAPTAGPGWEPANQALVDATLAQSAMSAQGNAERLKAEMSGARS